MTGLKSFIWSLINEQWQLVFLTWIAMRMTYIKIIAYASCRPLWVIKWLPVSSLIKMHEMREISEPQFLPRGCLIWFQISGLRLREKSGKSAATGFPVCFKCKCNQNKIPTCNNRPALFQAIQGDRSYNKPYKRCAYFKLCCLEISWIEDVPIPL